MQMAGSQIGIIWAIARFSYFVVPVGNVPSTGRALTGSWSPSPAISRDVIRATKSGTSSGTGGVVGRSLVTPPSVHVAEALERVVDRREVARDDGLAALRVGLLDERLDLGDGLLGRQDAGELEEARLHDGVDPAAHAGLVGDGERVDHPEVDLLVDEQLLDAAGQVVPDLVRARTGR